MRTPPVLFVATLCTLFSSAQGEPSAPTTPTAAPNPAATQNHVTSSTTYDLGDRLLTVQEVTKDILPTPVPTAPTATAAVDFGTSPQWNALRKEWLKTRRLSFGGTVYRRAAEPARSLIHFHPGGVSAPVIFWSSIDWSLLTPGSFVSGSGTPYSLSLMLSPCDIDRMEALWQARGGDYPAPEIPDFTAGPASYQVISGATSPELLADLDAIHAYHDRDYQTLLSAWQTRENARLAAAAPTTPAAPKDIVIKYRLLEPGEGE